MIGSFRNDKDEYRKIGQFVLVNYPEFTNAPKGMKFYSIYPSNHEAQAIVGISDKNYPKWISNSYQRLSTVIRAWQRV